MGMILAYFIPIFRPFIDMSFFDDDAVNFFASIIKKTIEERSKSPSYRIDFITTLTEAIDNAGREFEQAEDQDQFHEDAKLKEKVATPTFTSKEELEFLHISNALLLFLAGFDTSSTALAITLYFLAKNPVCQYRLAKEVDEAIERNHDDDNLDYNALQGLRFLENCINESLRLYLVSYIERKCVQEYTIPGTDIKIPKDMLVTIPSLTIMRSPGIFFTSQRILP